MTRRLVAVAVAVLATVAAAVAAGLTASHVDDDAWKQQLCDAQTAMDANQEALGAAPVNGQDPQTLQQQYQAAANAYDQAAAHLQLTQLDPSTECTP